MEKRAFKDSLYEQVARIGKAVSSPKRLEVLELLAQGEKTVEALASGLSIDIRLASSHLKGLKAARLVDCRRDGRYMVYRLSGNDVATMWVTLRQVAEMHLLELRSAIDVLMPGVRFAPVGRDVLLAQARRGEIVVIDVRPFDEYRVAHLPLARSMPLAEIAQRLSELPTDKEIVAYCRGPFCLMADEAVSLLVAHGFQARKLSDGVSEWRAAGLELQVAAKGDLCGGTQR